MDTSLRSRIQEDHLSCSICFNRFTTPKALPCVHTFCQGCLDNYMSVQMSQSKTPTQTFPCPICRADIHIPPLGAAGFPDNHMIASLLDTLESAPATPQTPQIPPVPPRTTPPLPPRDGPPVPPRPSPPVPQRPSSMAGDISKDYLSPAPLTVPVVPPRPKSTSPIPKRAKNTSPGPRHAAEDPLPRTTNSPHSGFGQVLTGGIVAIEGAVGSAIGGISTAISGLSGQLYPSKPIQKKDATMLPFEFVEHEDTADHPGQSPAGLYPELPQPLGPCMQGVVLSFGKYGSHVNSFLHPYGMSVGLTGQFVISDLKGNRVFVFNNEGKLRRRFNTDCSVKDVAVIKDDQILMAITGSGSSIMRLYTIEGKCLQKYGEFYRYDSPSGIAVSPSNHVIVTNLAANNVLVFTEQRKFSTKFGSKGAGEKHFMNPCFVTTTSKDYIVVSDRDNCCVKMFDMQGNFKRLFGSPGKNHGHLMAPMGICTDAQDNVIIADSYNFRVEIYTVKGMYYSTLVEHTNQIGPDVRPVNVAVTPRNNIAVLLCGTGFAEVRVYHWQPSTACRAGFSNV